MALIVREACTHNFVQTNGNAIILGTFGQATPPLYNILFDQYSLKHVFGGYIWKLQQELSTFFHRHRKTYQKPSFQKYLIPNNFENQLETIRFNCFCWFHSCAYCQSINRSFIPAGTLHLFGEVLVVHLKHCGHKGCDILHAKRWSHVTFLQKQLRGNLLPGDLNTKSFMENLLRMIALP